MKRKKIGKRLGLPVLILLLLMFMGNLVDRAQNIALSQEAARAHQGLVHYEVQKHVYSQVLASVLGDTLSLAIKRFILGFGNQIEGEQAPAPEETSRSPRKAVWVAIIVCLLTLLLGLGYLALRSTSRGPERLRPGDVNNPVADSDQPIDSSDEQMQMLYAQQEQARKMEAIGVLAGGIAHDFNNVLQAISGTVQILLLRTDMESSVRDALTGIDTLTQRAAEMIHQLLTLSRKERSRLEPVLLIQEIGQVCRILERILPKMIRLELKLAPDLQLIRGDPSQLEQIILNLAANATDAMPKGGSLVFETQNLDLDEMFCRSHPELEPGPHVLLKVSDSGVGMDRQTLGHIFEPFFTTKQSGRGTGLGLSTVYGIVALHKGLITCCSAPGQGTVFNIYLPLLAAYYVPSLPPKMLQTRHP